MNVPRGHWAARYELERQQARILCDAILENGGTIEEARGRSADSQLWDMSVDPVMVARMIPAVGAAASAIPGTDPVRALLAKEARKRS